MHSNRTFLISCCSTFLLTTFAAAPTVAAQDSLKAVKDLYASAAYEDALTAVGKIPEVRTALEKFGVLQTELPGPAYAESLRKERAAYARVIEKAGIKIP